MILAVASGKGGTGKTSLTASFAVLAGRPVIADCDVDAADLHLVLSPRVRERHEFRSGREAVIRPEACTGCGLCSILCRFGAVLSVSSSHSWSITICMSVPKRESDGSLRRSGD